MKRFRRLSAFVMVLTLLVSLSINVWAADYDAASMDDLWSAFNDLSGEDVNINLTTDIDGYDPAIDGYYGVSGQDGINYNISSENNSSLSNIFFSGGESITVNTDISGMTHFDNTNATVNGDVTGELGAYEATVDVSGDVGGIWANNSTVSIDGDVNGTVSAGLDSTVDIAGDVNAQSENSWTGIDAYDNAVVNVGGDVNAKDGNPDDVDYSDPYGYSDGGTGINAYNDATVTVGGDVNGGDGYGTYAYGGSGISVGDSATVTVGGNVSGGNVTADPETSAEDYCISQGGTAISAAATATVNVGGDVNGGNTNGDSGVGGNGLFVYSTESDAEVGSVTVDGTVSGGEGEEEVSDIVLVKEGENAPNPEVSVGSSETIEGFGFTEEELEQLKEDIEATYTKVYTMWDHLNGILWMVRTAQAGDEITVDMSSYPVLSTAIIEAVKEVDVTLIIKWNGGDDLVIDKNFSAEIEGDTIQMVELAELLKK